MCCWASGIRDVAKNRILYAGPSNAAFRRNPRSATTAWEQAPRYLIRDRDGAYGEVFGSGCCGKQDLVAGKLRTEILSPADRQLVARKVAKARWAASVEPGKKEHQ